MLGLFRKILSRPEPSVAVAAKPAPAKPALAKPTPSARALAPSTGKPPVPVAARVATPLSPPVQPQPQAPARPAPPPPTATHVQVPLTAIAAALPESFSHKVPANPDQYVAVPVAKVLPQLAHGQIILSAADLHECAPECFSALAAHDNVSVTLPLGDIVKQLSSEHFSRRDQRRVEVPAEVSSVFGGDGSSGVKVTRPGSGQAYHAQAAVTTTTTPAVTATPPGRASLSPQALAALNGRATTPTTVAKPASPVPAATNQPLARAITATVPKKPSIPAPKKITGELTVPLAAVCGDWVQEVKTQLSEIEIEEAKVLIPLEVLEPAMRSGKVVFSWIEVAGWILPPLQISPTPKVGEMPVEFPLPVVAPMFMANHRGAAQKRLTVDDNIPDVFAGDILGDPKQSQIMVAPRETAPAPAQSAAPAAPSVPAAAPAPAPAKNGTSVIPASAALRAAIQAAPALPKPEAKPASPAPQAPPKEEISLDQVIGPAERRFGVKEIVTKSARLPGVTGALLAMTDGLMVTSQTPSDVKADMVAAFLPQMFGRMNQYTKELSLGPLEELTLVVGKGQWHVIKATNIYFAVLGKRGESIPLNLLAQIAAELSNQSK